MSELTPAQRQQREKFQQLYEQGVFDFEMYRTALAGLGIEVSRGDVVDTKIVEGPEIHGNVENLNMGPPPEDPEEALAVYRRVLANECCHLPLRGVAQGAGDPNRGRRQMELAHVYVQLATKSRRSALKAVIYNSRVVLTGDPGGGKTTFVRHLAYCLARHSLEPDEGWLDRLPDWWETEVDTLPILVTLRDFARELPAELPARAEPEHLWNFIVSCLQKKNLDFVAEHIHDVLERGEALVLLDGLDEVTTTAQRAFVRDAVAAFIKRYHKEARDRNNRYLATCRVLSYREEDLQLRDFEQYELAPFDEERIDSFIEAWYAELAGIGAARAEDVEKLTQKLKDAVRLPDMWRLAPNPLLLTTMAVVHADKGRLPEARAQLYEETIEILLWRWEQVGKGDATLSHLLQEAGRGDLDLRRTLRKLAFQVHEELKPNAAQDDIAYISAASLERELAALHPNESLVWARRVVEVMTTRAGLLLEYEPHSFGFPHRTFQEYLAGAYLARQPNLSQRTAELARRGANWREVILLAVGHQVYVMEDDYEKPLLIVGGLCPPQVEDTEAAWRAAWWAGDALLEMGVNRAEDSPEGQDKLERVRGRLVELIERGKLPVRERVTAGITLSALGDSRDFDEMITIPAGEFLMGSDEHGDEKPPHPVYLSAYRIGKYPVTNAQYLEFVEVTGREWKGMNEARRPERRTCPARYVSWYDAAAYCNWRSAREGLTPCYRGEGDNIKCDFTANGYRLPTEAEWEHAARGTDGRKWPWGNTWDKEKCNSRDLGLKDTTPVGIFPNGASPAGCLDMAGNVDEWCGDWYAGDYYANSPARNPAGPVTGGCRVVRGGSWFSDLDFARGAYRRRYSPFDRGDPLGFRCAASPGSLYS